LSINYAFNSLGDLTVLRLSSAVSIAEQAWRCGVIFAAKAHAIIGYDAPANLRHKNIAT
jgi:hypothetical protein